MNKKSCETSEGATLEDVAPVLLLNDCFSLRQGQDVYALLSLVDVGYLTKSIIRSHYESKEDEGAWEWLDQSTELSKLTVPTLRSFSMELDGPCSSKDRKSSLVSYLSTFEGALRYLPAKAIGKARAFAESKRRAKLEELETRKRAKLVESVVGAEAMDGVVAMLLDERQKPRERIKYVDKENLLTALVEDHERNCTKKTCKSVLLLTDGDIADMPCTEAPNPIYSSRAPMRLYKLMKALEVSLKKHGGWSGLLKARESAERKSAERKRKRQETRNATLESERTFFEEHTSFDEYFKEEEDWMVEEANYKGRYINYRAIERDAYDEARYRALKEWVECHYDTLDHEIQQDYFPPSLKVKAKELYNMTSKTSRERTVMKRDKRQARLAEVQEEFGKRNLPVRDDSRLIKGYLARETPCPNELKFVADTMEEMRFYHEHTTYREIYSDIWDDLLYGSRDFESPYEREWVDKDEVSARAKKRALREWVLSHSDTLEQDIQHDNFPPSLRKKAQDINRSL
ncbi:hypothetical protein M9434_005802 [Picochlorum sp. BPE23]|nr:hypothetical protein M9434_005802 [Picochlorum sp. BPE23]